MIYRTRSASIAEKPGWRKPPSAYLPFAAEMARRYSSKKAKYLVGRNCIAGGNQTLEVKEW